MKQTVGTMSIITRSEKHTELFRDNIEATWNPKNQEIRIGSTIVGHAKKFHHAVFALLNLANKNKNFLALNKKTKVLISKIQSINVSKKIKNKHQKKAA